ncbi:MAG: UvrB/UvrC motif-containing protein [Candidatus Omnitrophica bacterium]|nr:UvrB/UvrC motif-containing protein [Candidatus Omnitrophota bacterium]
MVCNVCGQNEATIHLTEILNNQMVEVHLCESCAEQKGADFKSHFDFNKLLASLGDFGAELKAEHVSELVCKSCGLTYEEFGRTGRLGCSHCYRAFEKLLLPLIKRVQRGVQHIGKVPVGTSGDVKQTLELRELQDRLKKSIETETFEEAAHIRDRIQELKQKLKKGSKKQK